MIRSLFMVAALAVAPAAPSSDTHFLRPVSVPAQAATVTSVDQFKVLVQEMRKLGVEEFKLVGETPGGTLVGVGASSDGKHCFILYFDRSDSDDSDSGIKNVTVIETRPMLPYQKQTI